MYAGSGYLLPPDVNLRYDIQPGDLGQVISLHGLLYAREFGFDCTFEASVAVVISDFYLVFNPDQERLWLLETGSQITGSIGIVRRSYSEAQLRWFLVHPVHRGQGIGGLLLKEAINFCKDDKYRTISLSTFSELTKASKLYQNAGFQIRFSDYGEKDATTLGARRRSKGKQGDVLFASPKQGDVLFASLFRP